MQDHLRKQLEEAERHQALQEEKQRLEEQLAVWKEELEAIEKQLADNKLQNERDQLLLKNRLWKVPNPIMKTGASGTGNCGSRVITKAGGSTLTGIPTGFFQGAGAL